MRDQVITEIVKIGGHPMRKKIMYLAVDVDDKSFTSCGIIGSGKQEDIIEFKTKPSVGALMGKLQKYRDENYDIKVCYEATYLGYSLYRDLTKRGIECEVIAPSSIPSAPGHTVKTDKIDSRKLVRYYKNNLLTIVHIPEEKGEHVRNLVRTRMFLARQKRDLQRHVLAACRRVGLDYKASTKLKQPAYFTQGHIQWLETELNKHKSEELKFNIKMLLSQKRQVENQLENFDDEINKIANRPEYAKKVESLACYRGIDVLSAMSLITELGDIKRFKHPSQLASYAGLDLREYSSGGRERKFRISKMGNHRIRGTVIESCQSAHRIPVLSKRLKERRKKTKPEFIEVADKCMKRLSKKSFKLIQAGKPVNKVKVACAREMLCFVWESLNKAA